MRLYTFMSPEEEERIEGGFSDCIAARWHSCRKGKDKAYKYLESFYDLLIYAGWGSKDHREDVRAGFGKEWDQFVRAREEFIEKHQEMIDTCLNNDNIEEAAEKLGVDTYFLHNIYDRWVFNNSIPGSFRKLYKKD